MNDNNADKGSQRSLSLRTLHHCLIVITVILSALMVIATYHLTKTFNSVTAASEEHMELEKAALELMDASDFLTESVQRYTNKGNQRFMDDYFNEAFNSKRREEAISKMNADPNTKNAIKPLEKALEESVKLMEQEYYAMKLVLEAKGVKEYPDVLKTVELSKEDAALSVEEKMTLATEKVLSDEYYTQKDHIREHFRECMKEIDNLTKNIDSAEMASLHKELVYVRFVILLLIVSILGMVVLTSYLGIDPIIKATDQIKDDSPIEEQGANEFRYLARAYNKMYAAYKSSLEHLNFKASHDELTGAYNRAGYDLILSSIDLNSTYMIMVDVDDFKKINDTFGHEAGDKALIKLVRVLRNSFRSDDYICRIGGDEFVIFMVHSDLKQHHLIASKIEQINSDLKDPSNNEPTFSISAGIAHGCQAQNADDLFEKVDSALYTTKNNGKDTYTFYQ